jgi:hypothetical protein
VGPNTRTDFLQTGPPDVTLAAIAARQHGLVSLAQAIACGMSESTVQKRAHTGRLHRIHDGV